MSAARITHDFRDPQDGHIIHRGELVDVLRRSVEWGTHRELVRVKLVTESREINLLADDVEELIQ